MPYFAQKIDDYNWEIYHETAGGGSVSGLIATFTSQEMADHYVNAMNGEEAFSSVIRKFIRENFPA